MNAWHIKRMRVALFGTVAIILVVATGSLILGAAIPLGPSTPIAQASNRSVQPGASLQPGASSGAAASPSAEPTATPTATLVPTPTSDLPVSMNVDLAGLIASPGSIRGFWATAANGLYLSTDGGASWKRSRLPQLHKREAVELISAVDVDHVWAGVGGADDDNYCLPRKFYRTRDGGATWERMPLPLGVASCGVNVMFLDESRGFLFNLDRVELYRTSDGGDSWTAGGAVTDLWSVAASDTSTLWSYSPGGGAMCALCGKPLLHVSRDAGRTWSLVSIPGFVNKADYYNAGITGMYFATPSLGFLAVYGKGPMRIFRTADAGRTWVQVATTPEIVGGFSAVDASFWYCFDGLGDRKLLVTEDAGKTWRTETLGGWTLGFGDRHHAFRLAQTGDDPSAMTNTLFVSADGGRTWTPAALPS